MSRDLVQKEKNIWTLLQAEFYPPSSVQSLSHVRLFATPWTAAHQASLSITNSRSPPKPMSIKLVMPSNHLILCRPLLLLPSIFPSIRVFSNESALCLIIPPTFIIYNPNLNCQHPLDHGKRKRVPEKHLFLLYWLCQSLWLCESQETVENSERDGNTRTPDLPLEKSVCRSGSNS